MSLVYTAPINYGSLFYSAPIVLDILSYGPDLVYSPPGSASPTGTLTPPTTVAYAGESLIRDSIRQIAVSTTAFESCWVGSRLDWANRPASATAFSVQAKGTREIRGYDSAPDWTRIFQSTFRLAIYTRGTDSEQRDANATRLLDLMRAKLDGQSIAELTMPDCTKITDWNWHGDQGSITSMTPTKPDVSPPYRELEATLICDWIQGP